MQTVSLIYLFTLFVFLLILSLTLVNIKTSKTPSELPSPAVQINKNKAVPQETKNPKVEALVKITQNPEGRWAIFIKDLKTQNTYELNSAEVFGAASIYKLAVMYKAYDAIESDQLGKNTLLSGEKIAPDQTTPFPNQTETVSYSVQEALRLMITISDNNAAILLSEKLGWANIDKFMKQEGFSEINLVGANSPNVTARSISALLEKIYKKEAVNKKYSGEMIGLLLAQKVNDRIPKYLPANIKVAHKTGELEDLRHDAGIVYGKKGDYIFVFLSATAKPLDASETIATLSKEIFEELEK